MILISAMQAIMKVIPKMMSSWQKPAKTKSMYTRVVLRFRFFQTYVHIHRCCEFFAKIFELNSLVITHKTLHRNK